MEASREVKGQSVGHDEGDRLMGAKRKRKLFIRTEEEQIQWVIGETDKWVAKRTRKFLSRRRRRRADILGSGGDTNGGKEKKEVIQ